MTINISGMGRKGKDNRYKRYKENIVVSMFGWEKELVKFG